MSVIKMKQLAEEHWGFIRDFLNRENEDGLVRIETVHFLYVEAMVHGAKHEREQGGGENE